MTNERKDQPRPFSEHEKAVVREELRAFMHAHPARVPFSMRTLDSIEHIFFNPRIQFATATLGLLLVTGSGTAFAAQNALPGEPLYGIKVNVEEPIMGAFAVSPEAKATWNAQLAARRLSEAEQLAVQNKLTPATASTIAGGLDQATENFDASVSALATSTGNAATVATLASTMEATLAANTQVMHEIANAVPTAAPVLQPILSSVQERTISLNGARTAMDVAAAHASAEQIRLAAQAQLGDIQDQVDAVTANSRHVSIPSSSPASAQVHEAQQELQSGQQALDQGDYTSALENFQAASVAAHAAQLNLSIGAQLGAAAGIELPSASTSEAFATETDATVDVSSTTSTTTSSWHDHSVRFHPTLPIRSLPVHL